MLNDMDQASPDKRCLAASQGSWGTCQDGKWLCSQNFNSEVEELFMPDLMSLPNSSLRLVPHRIDNKLCMLLPFRDGCPQFNRAKTGERAEHLEKFLKHMRQFLANVGVKLVDFIIITQSDRGLFNKGVLFNVGASIAPYRGCDYFVLHDIDHIPLNSENRYEKPVLPTHLCTNSSDVGWENFVGGAVSLTLDHFQQINGFSNQYHGWGAEDADLFFRLQATWGNVVRLDPKKGYYMPMDHKKVDNQVTRDGQSAPKKNAEAVYKFQALGLSEKRTQMSSDGLRQIHEHAKIVSIDVYANTINITVDVMLDGQMQPLCDKGQVYSSKTESGSTVVTSSTV
jgi:hypothetical protein